MSNTLLLSTEQINLWMVCFTCAQEGNLQKWIGDIVVDVLSLV